MFAEFSKVLAACLGLLSVIGLTTYYSLDKDTVRVIRRSMRALNQHQYFRYEHLVYFIAKLGQRRFLLLALTAASYLVHTLFSIMGV